MNCPHCGQELSITGEDQDIGQIQKGKTAIIVSRDLIVTYECDGPEGCSGVYHWSKRTRKLTFISCY